MPPQRGRPCCNAETKHRHLGRLAASVAAAHRPSMERPLAGSATVKRASTAPSGCTRQLLRSSTCCPGQSTVISPPFSPLQPLDCERTSAPALRVQPPRGWYGGLASRSQEACVLGATQCGAAQPPPPPSKPFCPHTHDCLACRSHSPGEGSREVIAQRHAAHAGRVGVTGQARHGCRHLHAMALGQGSTHKVESSVCR